MWTADFVLGPGRSIQEDEPEEKRNLEDREGRKEEVKPAYLFSWHIPLGAEAA